MKNSWQKFITVSRRNKSDILVAIMIMALVFDFGAMWVIAFAFWAMELLQSYFKESKEV